MVKKALALALILVCLSSFAHASAFQNEPVPVLTIIGEAANQPLIGQIAVGEVIRNRAKAQSWYGSSPDLVCFKAKQFSFWNDRWNAWQWLHKNATPRTVEQARRAWEQSRWTGYAKGATHYCRVGTRASWKKKMIRVAVIEDHEFFKEKV